MRRMGDGAGNLLHNIDPTVDLVAYYMDGDTENAALAWVLFGPKARVSISTQPSSSGGIVLDGEGGDYSPGQLYDGVLSRRGRGLWPSGYCSESEWPNYKAPFTANRVTEPPWWIAAYPGAGPALYADSVAHQFTNHNDTWDESVVADFWPGVDRVPIPTPIPNLGGKNMIAAHPSLDGFWLTRADGAVEPFGECDYHGGANPGGDPQKPGGDLTPGDIVIGIAAHHTGNGYWLYALSGATFAYGDAPYLGNWK